MARTIRSRMQRLRRDYPSPVARRRVGRYCVGGALCLAQGRGRPWPDLFTLALALRQDNRRLPVDEAWASAQALIQHNTAGHFRHAWATLEAALRWRVPTHRR